MIQHKIIQIAAKEIGQTEKPANSNRTKYGKWAKFDGVAWCGIFVSWVYAHAGVPLPKIGFAFPGFAGTQTAMAQLKKWGKIVQQPEPGDIVFFDWNNDKRVDHVGIVVQLLSNGTVTTIEGNTSATNQSNGGNVERRTRNLKHCIFVRPFVLDNE
jgi:cell wall-associated NlpC family hydrolase